MHEAGCNAHLTEISRVGSAMIGKSTVICVSFNYKLSNQNELQKALASLCAIA